ncbi:pectate lyase [Gracilibacillus oryzae]|uniref:Pectate lyase n=1 Tax=Gracilibacillus oryzae TaxID=1672701 RepID=A0A7C8GRS7_9BACI|nr:pectate lyase [Gracilibacillus oryzae]KAB8127934.1 pectate lyase [Gracilibacillus oryzae]
MEKWKRFIYCGVISVLTFSTALPAITPTVVKANGEFNNVVIFEDNFNNEATGEVPSNLTVSEGGGTARIADLPSRENKSVYLEDTSEETNVIASKSFEDLAGIVTVEMKFMQETYTSSSKVMRIKGDGTPVIIETKDGNITYRTGDNYEPLIEVVEGQWYDIKVELDLENNTADVSIDGELKLEDAAFNGAASVVNFVESFTPNSSAVGHYIDDWKISGSTADEDEPEEEPSEPDTDEPSNVYEAEDAVISDAIIDNKHAGFTGTGFVDYNPNAPGGWIEWTVNVPADGEYTLDFRYAHGGTDLRPAEISVNGEVVEAELPFDPTGDFAGWETTSMTTNLTAGENVIRATGVAPSGGANIDHLKVYMPVDNMYEAEDAVLEDGTVIVDNKHAGFTGTGFIDYKPNAPGSWVEWTVDVPADGEYFLDFRYGHGGTDARPAEISVNGEVVEPELAFDPSGGWAEWVYTSTKANLTAGENVIRATGVGASGGANIDHLRVHNLAGESGEGAVETEQVELADVVSGLQLKQMQELGIAATSEAADDKAITRIEFMALVNDTFGFVSEDKFKNLSNEASVWEISQDEWYAYVLKAAQAAGYADHLVENGKISPNDEVTKQEAAEMIANAKGEAADSTDTSVLTWGEAKEMVAPLKKENQSEHVEIVGAHAVGTNVMAVTLNGKFDTFDVKDLEVVVPTGDWALLAPGFENLPIDKAAQTVNKFGQTVIVLHSLEAWDEAAEYVQEIEETKFSGDLDTAIAEADNLLTWQMDNGGWTKNWSHIYTRPWDGEEPRSEWINDDGAELGTIDNDATIGEMLYLAQVYQETQDPRYKESIEKGLDFLFDLQYESGGFAQVYPRRGNYSDYVTFNDGEMVNVLGLLDLIIERKYPFDSDLISEEYIAKAEQSIDLAVDYILEAQIEVDGKLTAWGAQHDPVTYEPREARAYEHPSISGSESIGVISYLMSRPQTDEINHAVSSALTWLDEVKLENTRYVSGDPNNVYFVEDPNSTAWYRFYEIGTNQPIFSGRDGIIKHDIMEIEEERRNGYSWGGHWGTQLLEIAETTGNYTNKVYVQVAGENSVDSQGRTLETGEVQQLEPQMEQMGELDSEMVVAKDGSGDYETVQAAIDAVPVNNSQPVTIFVKNGTYKEVVTIPDDKPFITLSGESETDTVITYDNYAGRDNGVGGTIGTSGSASVYFRADDLRVENLTIENSFDESADVEGKQAVAAYASGDRQYFRNVSFIGNQDTLYTHSGSQYYYQVYVEGDVDFIFGGARVVIEDSVIHSYDRGSDSNNGYITAASTLLSDEYGMLILDSKLTSDAAANTVYLGRPWPAGGNPEARGSVVYMNSELGAHIKEEGWTSMSGLEPEDARLYEYNNYGPGAVVNESRRQLTDEEAAQWTVANVLKGWNAQALNDEDAEEPEEDKTPEEIKMHVGKETEVKANTELSIVSAQTKLVIPEDLPAGTKLTVERVTGKEAKELASPGDKVFKLHFTYSDEDYAGEYELRKREGHPSSEKEKFFLLDSETESWELIEGN